MVVFIAETTFIEVTIQISLLSMFTANYKCDYSYIYVTCNIETLWLTFVSSFNIYLPLEVTVKVDISLRHDIKNKMSVLVTSMK